jgi:hypothetical protein
LLTHFDKVLKSRAVFVLVALVEHTSFSAQISDKIKKLIKKGKLAPGSSNNGAGLNLLCEIVGKQ